ncbi:metal-dependent transcriptional regulator [Thomasclavelia sp.]|uniref:metal-dependent transcriptional regulator n=1 Tax=Thomasclavelia sp. TaxID=3025757 RepID=UPI0025E4EBA3|nr:metal-dependent transcriptional regulator [Thomasclavelia sp.]
MHESGEMYLETILLLKKRNNSVRSIDIAKELNFSKPSVSRGVGILKNDGYIIVDEKGYIELTELGMQKASSVYEKHLYLTDFLMITANVSKTVAEEDACRIEHIISDEVFTGIKNFVESSKK